MASADVKVLDLTGLRNLTTLSDYFAAYCPHLEAIHFPPSLPAVTSIPSFFLYDCQALKSLDLSAFINVTSISRDFLSGCVGLRNLDFRGFGRVASISDCFLSGCSGLTTPPDFTPMVALRSIGKSFMSGCCGLTEVELGGLGKVDIIPSDFLSDCTGLTSINFSGMDSVTTIHEYCLFGCTHLMTGRVDMRALGALSAIPADMMDTYGARLLLPHHLGKAVPPS